MPGSHALEVKDLTITLGGNPILKELCFHVATGEIVGFIGENGSGKSTTMKAIANLIFPGQGKVWIAGHDVRVESETALSRLSAQIEDPVFFENLSGGDNLRFFTRLRGVKEEVAFSFLEDYKLMNVKKRKVKRYSIGMRRRLALCIALAYDADLYVLDEPFSGMDQQGMKVFSEHLQSIRERGKSVLISSHQLTELGQVMDRAVYIAEGRMVDYPESVASSSLAN